MCSGTVFEIIRKEFAGIFQAALAAIAGFGEGTPQQDLPKGQNRRYADFGTVVESCSKKLPVCRSLPTATFSGNRNQFFHKRLRAGVLPLFLAKTFPAAWSFPTIRRFRSCVLPAA